MPTPRNGKIPFNNSWIQIMTKIYSFVASRTLPKIITEIHHFLIYPANKHAEAKCNLLGRGI